MQNIDCDSESSILFQVLNHEIEMELLEMTKKVAREFFKLPLEEKEKYEMVPGTIQGYGHAFIFSEDQKYLVDMILDLSMTKY